MRVIDGFLFGFELRNLRTKIEIINIMSIINRHNENDFNHLLSCVYREVFFVQFLHFQPGIWLIIHCLNDLFST